MRRLLLILPLLLSFIVSSAQVILYNNGTVAKMNPGCVVYIQNGAVHNDQGQIQNSGQLIVDQDYVNDDQSSGDGLYDIKGDFENNSIFTAGLSEVNLSGANQLITGSSLTTFYDLNLTGTGVKTMTLSARVGNQLMLNDRELSTGTFTMFVDNDAVTAVTESGGFVSSLGNGRLSRATSLASGYLFPLGSTVGTTRIRSLMITPSSSSANIYAARFVNNDPSTDGYNRSLSLNPVCTVNDKFYHLIERTSGSSSMQLAMYYIAAQDGNWGGIGHWQNVPQWENTSNAVGGIVGTYNTVTIGNWNNFTLPPYALINFGATPTITANGNILSTSTGGVSYQWYYNGNPIAGATGLTHDAYETGSGTYYVEVIYGDGCVGTSNIIELTVSGIYDIDGLTNLSLFPNPGNGQFIISGELQSPSDLTVTFTDVLGRKIREDIVLNSASSVMEHIDLSEHANGVYFVTLHSEKGRKSVRYIKN